MQQKTKICANIDTIKCKLLITVSFIFNTNFAFKLNEIMACGTWGNVFDSYE